MDELNLIDICQQIGSVAGSSRLFTAGLNRKLAAKNKPIEELTIDELLAAINQYNDVFNCIDQHMATRRKQKIFKILGGQP
jgi:hypothetical protein